LFFFNIFTYKKERNKSEENEKREIGRHPGKKE